jgi:hypothetical protein
MKLPAWCQKILSFLVRRMIAPGFVFVGGLLAIIDLRFLVPGVTIDYNGQPSSDIGIRLTCVLFPVLMAIFGGVLFRVKEADLFADWNK